MSAIAELLAGGPTLEPGQVWLVGAGPGDPRLLTVAAISGLRQADVVVYDALVSEQVLALARPEAQRQFAGKRGGKPSAKQADITAVLIGLAKAGKRVLRLKGGDPFVFGRGGEETLALAKAGIPFLVVPGVTAGLAALTAAAIPATMRGFNQALILATGHGADDADGPDWPALARTGQPLVLYMAMAHLPRIADRLMEGGLAPSTPAAAIKGASTADERVVVSTLGSLVEAVAIAGLQPPATVVIGHIVSVRADLHALATSLRSVAA
jgi:uroporphyrin-III C-methyltransferase